MTRSDWTRALSRFQRPLLLIAVVAVSVTSILTIAVPSWRRASEDTRRIEATTARCEALNDWVAAGTWLDASARIWEPAQTQVYERRFPSHKDREQLFLALARVAREAAIEPLELREEAAVEDEAQLEPEEPTTDPAVEEMVNRFLPETTELPPDRLTTYRLTASFAADYRRLARFVGGLQRLDRAVTVRQLDAVPAPGGLTVEMELEFYAQDGD
jgi:hypothetical protein